MQEFEFMGKWEQVTTFWNSAVIAAYSTMIKCNAITENVSKKDDSQKIIHEPKNLDEIVTTLTTALTTVTNINNAPEGFRKYMGYLDRLHLSKQLILEGESHTSYSLRKLFLPTKKVSSQIINTISAVCAMSLNKWVNGLSINYPAVENPSCKIFLMSDAYHFTSVSQFQSRSDFEMLGKQYSDLLQDLKRKI